MSRVRANGLDFTIKDSGTGEPLILVHGGSTDRHQYDTFSPLLGDGIRTIACDQRDSPDTPCPPEPYTMHDHADDLAGIVKALELDRVHIFGVSYGGAVAMTTAIRHPNIVKSLILGATAACADHFRSEGMLEKQKEGAEALQQYMLQLFITPEAIKDDPGLIAEMETGLAARDPDATGRRMQALASHDVRESLSKITAPTLVMTGDGDALTPEDTAIWMAEQIPNSEFVRLQGSRHGITLQHRDRTADYTRKFVLRNV